MCPVCGYPELERDPGYVTSFSYESYLDKARGFTLIELAIVLVVIGLIIGGILVGRDLISAAAVRAQISQIEKYQQAVNTFRGKYGYLPGDIPDPDATRFGFVARGRYQGEGDGDGLLMGIYSDGAGQAISIGGTGSGEQLMFWADLSRAKLIADSFISTANPTTPQVGNLTGTGIANYIASAKLSSDDYVLVWSNVDDNNGNSCYSVLPCQENYFGVQAVTSLSYGVPSPSASLGITVAQASSMDSKVDDGLPLSGNIRAYFLGYDHDGDFSLLPSGQVAGIVTNITASDSTCFDDVGGTTTPRYSVAWNGGRASRCALVFKFK